MEKWAAKFDVSSGQCAAFDNTDSLTVVFSS